MDNVQEESQTLLQSDIPSVSDNRLSKTEEDNSDISGNELNFMVGLEKDCGLVFSNEDYKEAFNEAKSDLLDSKTSEDQLSSIVQAAYKNGDVERNLELPQDWQVVTTARSKGYFGVALWNPKQCKVFIVHIVIHSMFNILSRNVLAGMWYPLISFNYKTLKLLRYKPQIRSAMTFTEHIKNEFGSKNVKLSFGGNAEWFANLTRFSAKNLHIKKHANGKEYFTLNSEPQQYSSPHNFLIKKDSNLILSDPYFVDKLSPKILSDQEFFNQQPFPSPKEMASMAKAAYALSSLNYTGHANLPEGYQILTTASNNSWGNCYFGVAFWNPDSHQVVVAHRGTIVNSVKNFLSILLVTDLVGVALTRYIPQVESAITFAEIIRAAVEKHPSVRISFTGHSLGGWLSQITTFSLKCLRLRQDESYFSFIPESVEDFHPRTVAFETPGCRQMLTKLKSDFCPKYQNQIDLDKRLDITVYLSVPNLVNTSNLHLGTIYGFKENLYGWTQRLNCLGHLLESHTIANIVTAFESDPPLSELVNEVVDFPSGNDKRHHLQEYDGKMCTLRLFSTEELFLLSMLETLHGKFELRKHEVEKMITELPKIALDGEAYKLKLSDEKSLNKVIKITKQGIRGFRQIVLSLLNMHTYRITHNELYYKDSFGLNDFLSNSEQRIILLVAEDVSIASAIHSVLQNSDKKTAAYLKWQHLETLLKITDITTVFKMANVVLLECDPSHSSGFIYDIVNYIGESKSYTGKCILLTTNDDQRLNMLSNLFSRYPNIYKYQYIPLESLELTEVSQNTFLKNRLSKELPDIYSMDVFYQATDAELCITDIVRCLKTEENTKFVVSCVDKQTDIYESLEEETKNEFISAERRELITVRCYAVKDITMQMQDFVDYCKDNLSYKVIWLEHYSGTAYICKYIFNRALCMLRKLKTRWFVDKNVMETALQSSKLTDICVFVTEEKQNPFLLKLKLLKNVHIVESIDNMLERIKDKRTGTHALKHTDSDHLEWIKSINSTKNFEPYILRKDPTDNECFDYTDEDNFVSKMNKLVIIADQPGMGKTTTTTRLLNNFTNWGRIHFNLKSCITDISSMNTNLTIQDVVEFLVKHVAHDRDRLDESLLKNILHKSLTDNRGSTPLIIILDGFDEIPKRSQGKDLHAKLLVFIKFLSENTTARVWVTTRTYYLEELQEQLPVLATTFLKISESEQKQYLKYHWGTILRLQLSNPKLEEELSNYVEEMYQTAVHILDKSIVDIMGVPLLVRMLLEVARPKCIDEYHIDKSVFKLDNVVTLYEEFVQLKFRIYFTHKGLGPMMETQEDMLKDSLCRGLENFAFSNHFPKEAGEFVSQGDESLVEYARLGLVHKILNATGSTEFIHRTLQEFFCARKLLRCLISKSVSAGMVRLLLTEVLLGKEHKVIRFFLNHFFETTRVNPERLLINHIRDVWKRARHKLFDENCRSCLTVAAMERLQSLMEFLVTALGEYAFKLMITQNVNGYTPLAAAMKHLDKSFVMRLKNSFTVDQRTQIAEATVLENPVHLDNKTYREISLYWGLDPLNVDLIRRYLTDNNFWIKPDNLSLIEEHLWSNEFFKGKALVKAASMGYYQTTEILVSRINYLDNYGLFGKTALLAAAEGGHFAIVDLLLRKGANVQILGCYDHSSLLHYAVGNAKSLESINRIGQLIRTTFPSLKPEYAKDAAGCTILHRLINGYVNNPDTMQPFCQLIDLLLEYGIELNEEDSMGRTPIMYASNKLSFEVVEHLIKRGANVTASNGRTALREVLVQFNPFETTSQVRSKIAKYLIDRGTDVNYSDENGATPLHLACASVLPDLVEYIISKGAEVNAKSDSGWTPLHYVLIQVAPNQELQSKKFEIVKMLVENSANVNIVNKDGVTPLGMARQITPEIVEFLKSKDAVVKVVD